MTTEQFASFSDNAVMFAGIVAALFVWVFPWVETWLPFTDVTVDENAEAVA